MIKMGHSSRRDIAEVSSMDITWRRGKRARKDHLSNNNNGKEGSLAGKNNLLGCADNIAVSCLPNKEASALMNRQPARSPVFRNQKPYQCRGHEKAVSEAYAHEDTKKKYELAMLEAKIKHQVEKKAPCRLARTPSIVKLEDAIRSEVISRRRRRNSRRKDLCNNNNIGKEAGSVMGKNNLLGCAHNRVLDHPIIKNHQHKQHKSHIQNAVVDGYYQSETKKKVCPCSSSSAQVSDGSTQRTQNNICFAHWMTGNCLHGENCKYVHSWCFGKGLSMVAQLHGHKKAVTGITLPFASDKLITGSKEGNVRVWNCHTGECIATFDMGSEVGCLISEGPCVFVGIENAVKAWNIETNAELHLSAPGGLVHAMTLDNSRQLFAGVHDGSILAWRFNSETTAEATASLKGHTGPVVSLVFGGDKLYSGSTDNTIRQWDLENMQCIHMLSAHSEVVMSMVCWDVYLLSCSLDRTLKIWAATESGDLEVVYTHKEKHGILALCSMVDGEGKPILLCSCNDKSVRLYELPSFMERGRIYVEQAVRRIGVGPGGLIFTGDATGRLSVWRLSTDSTAIPDKSTPEQVLHLERRA